MASKVRVSRLDSLITGSPVGLVAGPFDVPDRIGIIRRLEAMSVRDPGNRVGLVPSRQTTKWDFSPEFTSAVLDSATVLAAEREQALPVEQLLNLVVASDIDVPLAVLPYGNYFVLRIDHGIGDAHTMLNVVAALSAHGGADDANPANRRNLRHPIPRAAANIATTAPRRVLLDACDTGRAVLEKIRQRRSANADPADLRPAAPSGLGYRAVHVTTNDDYTDELRRYRAAEGIDISLPAFTLFRLCQAFEAAGIPVESDVEVLVDLRKFLPAGTWASGNFLAVAHVSYDAEVTAEAFGRDFAETVSSTKPLINLIGYLCLSRLRAAVHRFAADDWAPAEGTRTGRASVTLSDITRLPERRGIRWTDTVRRDMAVALPPASRSHIAILVNAPVDGELAVTASFFPSEFEPAAVRRALRLALTVPRVLGSTG